MPSQPAWFHRLEEIFTGPAFHDIHSPRPPGGRETLPSAPRRARQIMAGLEGLRVGNAAAGSREALIARLEQTAAARIFQWEGNRRARVVARLL